MKRKFRVTIIMEFDDTEWEFHTGGIESIEEIKKEK